MWKMPHLSKKDYDPIEGMPVEKLYSEDSFKHGVQFFAKYVGTLDVPRPQNRLEIVAAMRRIRYEFRAKAIKKRKIIFTVSVDGVFVNLRKSRKKHQYWERTTSLLLQHPVHRIFYVSHDSQDLKIFSYIARDSQSNVFKCHVFKSYKKGQAMRIVRTVGQAFDVCHKLTNSQSKDEKAKTDDSDREAKSIADASPGQPRTLSRKDMDLPLPAPDSDDDSEEKKAGTDSEKRTADVATSPVGPLNSEGPLSSYHQMQLLKHQLEQQTQQTQIALAQVQLLKDQLAAETTARLESQGRVHQLLVQNRHLLDHLNQTVHQIQQLESGRPVTAERPSSLSVSRVTSSSSSEFPVKGMLQTILDGVQPAATSPSSSLLLQGLNDMDPVQHSPLGCRASLSSMYRNKMAAAPPSSILSANGPISHHQDSPDSGHKEMSADSLSQALSFVDAYPPVSGEAKDLTFASDDLRLGWHWLRSGDCTTDSNHDDTPLATSVHSLSTNETTCMSDSEQAQLSTPGVMSSTNPWCDENANDCGVLPTPNPAPAVSSAPKVALPEGADSLEVAACSTTDLSPVSSTASQCTARPNETPLFLSNRPLMIDSSKMMI